MNPVERSRSPPTTALDEPLSSGGGSLLVPNDNAAPPWSAIGKRLPHTPKGSINYTEAFSIAPMLANPLKALSVNTGVAVPLLLTRTWERPPLKTSPVRVESPRPGAKYDVDRFNGVAYEKSVRPLLRVFMCETPPFLYLFLRFRVFSKNLVSSCVQVLSTRRNVPTTRMVPLPRYVVVAPQARPKERPCQPSTAEVAGLAVISSASSLAAASTAGEGLRAASLTVDLALVKSALPLLDPDGLSPVLLGNANSLKTKKELALFGLREPTGVFKASQEELRRRPAKPPACEWKRTFKVEGISAAAKLEVHRSPAGKAYVFI